MGACVAGRDAPHGVRGARARDQHRHKGEHGAGRHGPSFAHRPRRCVSPTAEVRASRLEQRPCLAWLGLIDNIIQTWTKDSPEQRRCVARDDGAIMSTLDFARFTSYNIKTLGGGRPPPSGVRPPPPAAAPTHGRRVSFHLVCRRKPPCRKMPLSGGSRRHRRAPRPPVAAHDASRLRALMRTPPRFPRANSCCTVE